MYTILNNEEINKMKVTQAYQQLIQQKDDLYDRGFSTEWAIEDWKNIRRLLQLFMEQGEDMDYYDFLDVVRYIAEKELDMADYDPMDYRGDDE
jgi:hypothetical protein